MNNDTKEIRIVIFTEGGSEFGLGHISRCSSLYKELLVRGYNVEFLIYGDTNNIDFIQDKKYTVKNWLSKEFLRDYIGANDYCIVDSYLAGEVLYNVISQRAKKCLFIDDNARILYPKGIIVNPSFNTKVVKYPKNDKNSYLIGHEYIILRSPFVNVERKTINSKVKEVLITLGGSDMRSLTPIILTKLSSRYPDMTFNVVIGNAFKNIDRIKEISSENLNFYENVSAEEMKEVMLKSDVAITAAGQTIYELLATKTPFIPIKIIDNQNNNVAGLKDFNLVKNILDYKDINFLQKIEDEFNKLLNIDKRTQIINRYNDVIDGLGSRRLIDKLVDDEEVR